MLPTQATDDPYKAVNLVPLREEILPRALQ